MHRSTTGVSAVFEVQIAELNALSQFSEDCVALLDSCQITFVPTGGSVSVTQFDGGTD
jgi:hypothetical protein